MISSTLLLLMTATQSIGMTEFAGQQEGLRLQEVGKGYEAAYIRILSGPTRKKSKGLPSAENGGELLYDAYLAETQSRERLVSFPLVVFANHEIRTGRPTRRLSPNKVYLSMMRSTLNGKLPMTQNDAILLSADVGAKSLLAAFEAPNHKLNPLLSELDLIGALFNSLLKQNWNEAARTSLFLNVSERSLFLANEPGETQQVGKSMAPILEATSQKQRDPLWRVFASMAFLQWRIRGSEQPYLQALLDSSHEVSSDVQLPLVDMEIVPRSGSIGVINSYKHVMYDREAIGNAVVDTRNDALREFLLGYVSIPSESMQLKLAQVLRSAHERTLEKLCELFDRLHGSESTKIAIVRDGSGRKRWANKDELVSYWRSYFGVRQA